MGGLLPLASLVALLMLVCGSARPSTVGALLVLSALPGGTRLRVRGQPGRGVSTGHAWFLLGPRSTVVNALGNIAIATDFRAWFNQPGLAHHRDLHRCDDVDERSDCSRSFIPGRRAAPGRTVRSTY